MKVIEAMKAVKANKQKIADLHGRINQSSANLSFETPVYGEKQRDRVAEWVQSCEDLAKNNVKLLVAISRTNLATHVTIELGDNTVTRSVAEWVWRRREYANMDLATWSKLTDRNLKEGNLPTTTGIATEVKIIRHYDPVVRDAKIDMYSRERFAIDSALEISNAVTDLIEA